MLKKGRAVSGGILSPTFPHLETVSNCAEQMVSPPLVRAAVPYTHLRAHKTLLDPDCRLLFEKKKNKKLYILSTQPFQSIKPFHCYLHNYR